jgi:hypothetical protein
VTEPSIISSSIRHHSVIVPADAAVRRKRNVDRLSSPQDVEPQRVEQACRHHVVGAGRVVLLAFAALLAFVPNLARVVGSQGPSDSSPTSS